MFVRCLVLVCVIQCVPCGVCGSKRRVLQYVTQGEIMPIYHIETIETIIIILQCIARMSYFLKKACKSLGNIPVVCLVFPHLTQIFSVNSTCSILRSLRH